MSDLTTPLVTVGITTYNNPEGLENALKCIVNQSYKNLEIIISDDCSPGKETKNIIKKFENKDKRIKSIRQKSNLGPPANINFVLTQATGEYFMWADDDDLRDSRWIEILLSKLSNKNVITSLGRVVAVDEFDNPIQNCNPIQFTGPRILRLARYYLAEENSGKACITCGIFRTEFVRKIKHWGKYELNKFGYGDNYFSFDCLQHGSVVSDQSVTIYKRISKNSKINEKSAFGFTIFTKIFYRIIFFAIFIRVASHFTDKVVIMILFPIKCMKSFAFYILRRFFHKI